MRKKQIIAVLAVVSLVVVIIGCAVLWWIDYSMKGANYVPQFKSGIEWELVRSQDGIYLLHKGAEQIPVITATSDRYKVIIAGQKNYTSLMMRLQKTTNDYTSYFLFFPENPTSLYEIDCVALYDNGTYVKNVRHVDLGWLPTPSGKEMCAGFDFEKDVQGTK